MSDFGLSRLLPNEVADKTESQPGFSGTVTHMAPELLSDCGPSRAADVYSFGILSTPHAAALFMHPVAP